MAAISAGAVMSLAVGAMLGQDDQDLRRGPLPTAGGRRHGKA
jgi:hypothetical protein